MFTFFFKILFYCEMSTKTDALIAMHIRDYLKRNPDDMVSIRLPLGYCRITRDDIGKKG